ncbi:hypothetical protein KIV40_27815 [Vibrio sp. D173a]|uniref:hypothetical protein n=1 Tax=Vibrio sp. D173a TaxID=2836349 RepID=UPI0025575DBC|nr:hypothetical protein [Vibrio sp. D173a]MDK9759049.1 hypothetical protein [Vibrio sp. D173a]
MKFINNWELQARNVPILILLFNRPGSARALIDALRDIKPAFLYIACDGARETVKGEAALVHDVKKIVDEHIDWNCQIFTLYNDRNLGCKLAVSSAIQWFFSHVKEGIVLEDDCIPSPGFFDYIAYYLEVFRNEKKIASIAGRREIEADNSCDIHFSSKFFCWGWASWSDRINSIDVEFGYQPDLPPYIMENLSFWESRHVKGIHNLMLDGIVNSWAYSYDLVFRSSRQLHVIPPVNFITNIGIGLGTHETREKEDKIYVEDGIFIAKATPPIVKNDPLVKLYFKKNYGVFKTLLFPYASLIKRVKKYLGIK